MKIGDLVKSCDPREKGTGFVSKIESDRIGFDGLKREVQVFWLKENTLSWAMRMSVEVINDR